VTDEHGAEADASVWHIQILYSGSGGVSGDAEATSR
jgi:hypothetical protein